MVNWLVFIGVCVLVMAGCVSVFRGVEEARRREERADRRRALIAAQWPPRMVLAHVTATGEVVEYPVIRGESLESLSVTLGEIAALTESHFLVDYVHVYRLAA